MCQTYTKGRLYNSLSRTRTNVPNRFHKISTYIYVASLETETSSFLLAICTYFLINFFHHFYSEFYVMHYEVLVVEPIIKLFFLEEKNKKHRLSSDSNI